MIPINTNSNKGTTTLTVPKVHNQHLKYQSAMTSHWRIDTNANYDMPHDNIELFLILKWT